MANCKKTPHDFIQDVFSPRVAVFCSHDADVVCKKNDLSFVQLIQPFCRLNSEVHIRDPGNISHTVRNLRVIVQDMNSLPPQPTLAKKQLNDVVANSLPAGSTTAAGQDTGIPGVSNVVSVGNYDLQLSTSTPWYEAYREKFLQIMYPSDHEFTGHLLACIFVVSSNHPEPMEQFGWLTGQQHQQQHQQPHKLPKWFCPNVLRYYVLVHDVIDGQESKAESVFQKMKSTYDHNACHLLQINSQRPTPNGVAAGDVVLPNPWSQFIVNPHKNVDTLQEVDESPGLIPEDAVNFPCHVAEGPTPVDSALEVTEDDEDSGAVLDHPLATDDSPIDNTITPCDSQNNIKKSGSVSSLDVTSTCGSGGQHGGCLSLSDHDRLRIFVHEFVVRGLIPWTERTLRTLNDQVITRLKGIQRSIFGATKKWFGGGKPAAQISYSERTNVVYTSEAPEMQMRRLADLAFTFQLYEMAYQTYCAAKKDFNNDHAWLQYAAALEMASLSVFMQISSNQRQYPHHNMESAISTYLTNCKAPQYATRATLLNTEALKSKGLYAEAAMQLIKMTSEDSDLRSALLLEQAAHCFLKMHVPMVRKYAFHMILAGHRFSKACQRRHALRAYAQALQVYKGKSWALAEDHIHFTLGRQSFNLRHLENAASSFKHLLTIQSQQTPAQQAAFLREYLFVFKQSSSNDSSALTWSELPQLPLPVIDGNDCKIRYGPLSPDALSASGCLHADETAEESAKWRKLEELLLVRIQGSVPVRFTASVPCRTSQSSNSASPCCVIGEPIHVEVALVNPLKIPLVLTDISLLWRFLPTDTQENRTNETPDAAQVQNASELIETSSTPELILESLSTKKLRLMITPRHTGELHITGVAYHLGPGSPATTPIASSPSGPLDGEATASAFLQSIAVRGKVNLEVQGPRLNQTKEEITGKIYGLDRRLDLVIISHMPLLQVELDNVPSQMLCGQVQRLSLTLKNCGHLPLHNVHLACTEPRSIAFGDPSHVHEELSFLGPYLSHGSCASEDETVATPLDFVRRVPMQPLAPGESCSIPLWIRAPTDTSSSMHCVDLLFYYESTNNQQKLKYRVLRQSLCMAVRPSLGLRACASSSCIPTSASSRSLLLSLEVENLSNDASVSDFSVSQVSCAASPWSLQHINSLSEIKVSSAETSLLCLKAEPTEDVQDYSDVHFTDQKIASRLVPCRDFLRHDQSDLGSFCDVDPQPVMTASMLATAEGLNVAKVPPYHHLSMAVDLDLELVVLWKGVKDGLEVRGQHHLSLKKLDALVSCPVMSKVSHELPPVQIIPKRDADLLSPLPPSIATRLASLTLKHPHRVKHDFRAKRLCQVRVNLELGNCCEQELKILVKVVKTSNNDDDNDDIPSSLPLSTFSWFGHLKTQLSLPAKSSHSLQMSACFCRPGIYDLSSLSVLVTPSIQPDGVPPVEEIAQQITSPSVIEIST